MDPVTVTAGIHGTGVACQNCAEPVNARSATRNSTVNRKARLIDRVSTAIRIGIETNGRTARIRDTDLGQETGHRLRVVLQRLGPRPTAGTG